MSHTQAPRQSFTITLLNSGKHYSCDSESDLITTHNQTRVGSIPNRCHRGGCGLCRIQIIRGQYHSGSMSRSYISAEDQLRGIVLACCTRPKSDLEIIPLPDRSAFCLQLPQARQHSGLE